MTERLLIDGPAGRIEIALDTPAEAPRGAAVIAHPHPLFGGTLDNKVAQALARCFVELGYVSVRSNFRGVGATEGEHDNGEGETDDIEHVARWAMQRYETAAPVLAGFSFGAYVQTRVAKRIAPERMALVGVPNGLVTAGRSYASEAVPADTIVIHGELDDTVPLSNVLDWARPQDLPIVLVPGADHFFHRRLHIIRSIIKGAWRI